MFKNIDKSVIYTIFCINIFKNLYIVLKFKFLLYLVSKNITFGHRIKLFNYDTKRPFFFSQIFKVLS